MKFTAQAQGSLSESMDITSQYTKAEAYVGSGLEVSDVALNYRNGEGQVQSYALYQNEPNPFKGQTVISFNIPESTNATLKVYDVTGKVLYSQTAAYTKGMNSIKVDNLSTSGVLYYQLNADDFTATKKMIVIE